MNGPVVDAPVGRPAAVADDPVDVGERGGYDRVAIRALLGRDLGAVRRSKAVVLPMLLVPALILIILPLVIGLAANRGQGGPQIEPFLDLLPDSLSAPVLAYPPEQRLLILVLGFLVAPLFLIVPLMVSAVLSADVFVGEKERKTLETLLHLPLRSKDLYLAKLLTGFAPAVAIAWIGFAMFCAISNAVAWPRMHRLFLPTRAWAVLILWVTPAVAALGLGIMVRVSARSANTQEAQQLGGAVVLPLIILAVGQATGLLIAGVGFSLAVGAVIWVLAIVLNVRGARRFTRDRLAADL